MLLCVRAFPVGHQLHLWFAAVSLLYSSRFFTFSFQIESLKNNNGRKQRRLLFGMQMRPRQNHSRRAPLCASNCSSKEIISEADRRLSGVGCKLSICNPISYIISYINNNNNEHLNNLEVDKESKTMFY